MRKSAVRFFVAWNGSDRWSGKLAKPNRDGNDGPFASLERARDALRALRPLPEGGATVYLRGGTYPLKKTFKLTEEDGGRPDAPITYRPWRREKARLIGGRIVSGFRPVKDREVLARLQKEAQENVLMLDLGAQGFCDFGHLTSRGFSRPTSPAHMELFFGGRRMELARWPNDGFERIGSAAEEVAEGDGHGGSLGRLEAGFIYGGDRPHRWRSLEDIWVHGYWAWDWANSYEELESINHGTGRIKTKKPYGVYGFKAGQRFYFLNILEELDRPGEYYVDCEKGILYFWPPSTPEKAESAVSTLEEPIIRMEGVDWVILEGLTLEYCRGNGLEVLAGREVTIRGCTIRNVGNNGIVIEGGEGNAVRHCSVCNTGDGGIRVRGGDRKTLRPCGHEITDNRIHHIGQWTRCYQPGVMVRGVGIRVAHNEIHDSPHSAIILAGNDNTIEFNHIHHVCQETGDVGAFYMGRDWTQRGNVVRYNFFHDTAGYGMGSMAVYLDDCASGTNVYGNVFRGCSRAAFIGGGRDNVIENNIFLDCDPAVMIDGRGLDPSPVWHNMIYKTMRKSLLEMKHSEPPYSVHYPELAELDRYYEGDLGVPPDGNLVARNICLGGRWLEIHWHAEPRMIRVEDNLIVDDPRLLGLGPSDFHLDADSPAFDLGFEPIPFLEIGPRGQISSRD